MRPNAARCLPDEKGMGRHAPVRDRASCVPPRGSRCFARRLSSPGVELRVDRQASPQHPTGLLAWRPRAPVLMPIPLRRVGLFRTPRSQWILDPFAKIHPPNPRSFPVRTEPRWIRNRPKLHDFFQPLRPYKPDVAGSSPVPPTGSRVTSSDRPARAVVTRGRRLRKVLALSFSSDRRVRS